MDTNRAVLVNTVEGTPVYVTTSGTFIFEHDGDTRSYDLFDKAKAAIQGINERKDKIQRVKPKVALPALSRSETGGNYGGRAARSVRYVITGIHLTTGKLTTKPANQGVDELYPDHPRITAAMEERLGLQARLAVLHERLSRYKLSGPGRHSILDDERYLNAIEALEQRHALYTKQLDELTDPL